MGKLLEALERGYWHLALARIVEFDSLLCGQVFSATAPLGWILLVTIPGALLPGVMVGFFGIRQRRRTLEELSR